MLKALDTALKRDARRRGLLHHSDQGCTYASEDYQRLLDATPDRVLDEPTRQLSRKRGHGIVVLLPEDETAERFTGTAKRPLNRIRPTGPSIVLST